MLRALQSIVSAAKQASIPVSMCGEMAGDPAFSLVLLGLGFDELSMTAGQIPAVKRMVRQSSRAEAAQVLQAAMQLTTAEEIERYLRSELEKRAQPEPA